MLGEDLELRELQKKGKIGRINVSITSENNKTEGIIEIPTTLDKAETTIIAAALETIEKIGPTDAKITIQSIEDVRDKKRDYIINRAKKLLEQISGLESKEIEEAVISASRIGKLIEYGKEKLPAGPDVNSSKEVIIVEGRADVLNLLKYGIKNVIAMNGALVPETIKELGKEKELVIFIDGDRGGILNAKSAIKDANVSFVCSAPDGKEVEELTQKEILQCLRNKISGEDFLKKNYGKVSGYERRARGRTEGYEKRIRTKESERRTRPRIKEIREIELEKKPKKTLTPKKKKELEKNFEELQDSKKSRVYDYDLKLIKEIKVRNLNSFLYDLIKRGKDCYIIALDGNATISLIKAAEKANCQYLAAKNFTSGATKTEINLMSF